MSNGVSRETWNRAEDHDTKLDLLFDKLEYLEGLFSPKRIMMLGAMGGGLATILITSPQALSFAKFAVAAIK